MLRHVGKSVYDGPWDANAIEKWVRVREHPSVGFADSQHIRNFFRKEGIMVHLFVTKESVEGNWNAFQDFLFQEVAVPLFERNIVKRGTFSLVFSDGEENKKWLEGTSFENGSFPVAMLIDFV